MLQPKRAEEYECMECREKHLKPSLPKRIAPEPEMREAREKREGLSERLCPPPPKSHTAERQLSEAHQAKCPARASRYRRL
jgi:hypothetical protein